MVMEKEEEEKEKEMNCLLMMLRVEKHHHVTSYHEFINDTTMNNMKLCCLIRVAKWTEHYTLKL